jgi:hypothetical protein
MKSRSQASPTTGSTHVWPPAHLGASSRFVVARSLVGLILAILLLPGCDAESRAPDANGAGPVSTSKSDSAERLVAEHPVDEQLAEDTDASQYPAASPDPANTPVSEFAPASSDAARPEAKSKSDAKPKPEGDKHPPNEQSPEKQDADKKGVFISPGGDDANPGTRALPIQTLQRWAQMQKGRDGARTLVMLPGTYPETLHLKHDGTRIIADQSGTVIITPSGGNVVTIWANNVLLQGLVLDGKFQASHLVESKWGKSNIRLVDLECRNSVRHGIDLAFGSDSTIRGCHIHHCLWWNAAGGESSASNQRDAHGIVTTAHQRLSIIDCDIHHCSGDSFQADRGDTWQDITIRGTRMWTGPLDEASAQASGFPQGLTPGENAVDTKKAPRKDGKPTQRGRLLIEDCECFGFQPDLTSVKGAAFNLKEHVEVTLRNCHIHDNAYGLRLRGPVGHEASRGGATVTIEGCLVENNRLAIRHEDGLQNLTIRNSTFRGHGPGGEQLWQQAPGRVPHGPGWILEKNQGLTSPPAR